MESSAKILFYIYDVQIVLLLALIIVCLCFYANFIWKKRRMFLMSWNYPGPFNLPVIGIGYLFMTRPEYIFGRIVALQKKYPEGWKCWFGNRLIYSLQEPEHIEKVLGSNRLVKKEDLYKHVADCIGEGLITAPPEKWKRHRKIIMPSFNQKVLDSFVAIFAKQSTVLTQVLETNFGKKSNIYEILSRCTLDIVCESAMGLQLNIQKTNSKYGTIFDKIMLLVYLKIFHLWNHVDLIWKILGYDKKLKSYLKQFNDLTDLVIKQKMEDKKNRKSSLNFTDKVPSKQLAFLDYIMETGQFNALELRDEINIFLFAGTDTTASTLSFALALLGMFPEIQKKVYDEVIQIMGTDRAPEPKDLPQMTYTERVIKETLRLFPSGAFFLRTITEDVNMGDFVVPKGASVYFGLFFIHRNPKYWPDPLKFDPDRFLPEEVAKRHPCIYIPFSHGPRNCIGLKYSMMNMKVIIATVIRKFRIYCEYKNIEDIKVKSNLILRFQDGAKVSVTPRE